MRHDPEVVKVYARSLYEAVRGTGKVPDYIAEARAIRQVYLENSRLRSFLEGPHINEDEKQRLIAAVFGKGRALPLMYNFLRLLIHKKRTLMLPDMLEEFRRVAEEALGHIVGTAVSAVPLDANRQRLLVERLQKATGLVFTMDFKVDPEVLGGVLVRYQDVLIDGTLRGRFQELRARLRATV